MDAIVDSALAGPWRNLRSLRPRDPEYLLTRAPDAVYVCGYDKYPDTRVALVIAKHNPQLLDQWADDYLQGTEAEALELIAYGYGRKLRVSKLSTEFINRYAVDLCIERYTNKHWAELNDHDFIFECDPTLTESLGPRDLACMGSDDYLEKRSSEYQRAYAIARDALEKVPVLDDNTLNTLSGEQLTMFLMRDWSVACTEHMDEVDRAIDWLSQCGEFRGLASCFANQTESCDPWIALASRAPEALQYLDDRIVICDSNTVRDLFMLHGQGRKLSPWALTPEFAVRYWDEVGPLPHEWEDESWTALLNEAEDLPKSPLPMLVLLELVCSEDKLNRHLDLHGKYRALYYRIHARW